MGNDVRLRGMKSAQGSIRRSYAVILVAGLVSGYASSASPEQSVQVVKTADYLALSTELQAIYVAGIVDGMAYMLRNYDMPDHEEWTACVRKKPIADLVQKTNDHLLENVEYIDYPVAYALSKVIGQRRPC